MNKRVLRPLFNGNPDDWSAGTRFTEVSVNHSISPVYHYRFGKHSVFLIQIQTSQIFYQLLPRCIWPASTFYHSPFHNLYAISSNHSHPLLKHDHNITIMLEHSYKYPGPLFPVHISTPYKISHPFKLMLGSNNEITSTSITKVVTNVMLAPTKLHWSNKSVLQKQQSTINIMYFKWIFI